MVTFGDPIQITSPTHEVDVTTTQRVNVIDYVISSRALDSIMGEYLTVGAPKTVTKTHVRYICNPIRHEFSQAGLRSLVAKWISDRLKMSWSEISDRIKRGEKIYVSQAEYNACKNWVINTIAVSYTHLTLPTKA